MQVRCLLSRAFRFFLVVTVGKQEYKLPEICDCQPERILWPNSLCMMMHLKQAGPDSIRLAQLAVQETALRQHVEAATGTAGQINQYLQEQGVFQEYRQIHQEYAALAGFKRARVIRNEALKRALFLSWYSELEPASLTGLADLDEDITTELYGILSKILERGWMNEELEWMLRHYMQCEWVLLQYTENKLQLLTKWAKGLQAKPVRLEKMQLPAGTMNMRGLMGMYFKEQGVEEGS